MVVSVAVIILIQTDCDDHACAWDLRWLKEKQEDTLCMFSKKRNFLTHAIIEDSGYIYIFKKVAIIDVQYNLFTKYLD